MNNVGFGGSCSTSDRRDQVNDEEIDQIVKVADELKKKPERWGWKITAVLYGHGKVIVQCVTDKGTALQFKKGINIRNGKKADPVR